MLALLLQNDETSFSLACEEYLLKNRTEDLFMLWQSRPSVVVGKHQNALAEINYRYLREHDIQLARRISGGGTVFHDAGNVNFTYIKNVSGPGEISFRKFVEPIVEALAEWGLRAEISGRNDLLIEGYKISGNAEHVYKNRVLHHGTLLYNSHLDTLGDAIRVTPGKYLGKAVASNRSKVANIASFLKNPPSIEVFIEHLFQFHLKREGFQEIYQLSGEEKQAIAQLSAAKFQTEAWQLGYSPPYSFTNRYEENGLWLEIYLEVERGKITQTRLSGNLYNRATVDFLMETSPGVSHAYESIEGIFKGAGIVYTSESIYAWFQ